MSGGGGYGGQSFGGWGGNTYGGQSSFGGSRPYNQQAFGGKIGYEAQQQPAQMQAGPMWPPGGIPQMPQAPKAPSNPWMPAGAGNPLYSPDGSRPSVPPGGIPPMPPAPPQPPNPYIPAGVANPLYSGSARAIPDNNWYERGYGGPMTPQPRVQLMDGGAPSMQDASQQVQPQQRQAPPGYYFDQSGRMLAGMDPAQFNKGTNIYGGSPAGQYGGAGYVPGSGWQQMLDIYAREREANMAQAAPFGRYQDGSPMTDPSRNVRADYRLQNPAYAGGWPGYTPRG